MASTIKHISKKRCPSCGNASLFKGLTAFHEQCPSCGWPIGSKDIGDGPVFLVMTLLGILVSVLSVAIELIYAPPPWVHAVIALPLTLGLCIWMLRYCRGWMIHLIYRQEQQAILLQENNHVRDA